MSNMVKLVRRHDWDVRFTEFITDSVREGVALDWANFTCGSWVADGILEMTGVDLYADFRELRIESAIGAYKAICMKGYDSFDAIVAARLPEKGLAFAQRGDVCLVPAADTAYAELGMPHALCFVDPPFAWNITPEGVGRLELNGALKLFAVG